MSLCYALYYILLYTLCVHNTNIIMYYNVHNNVMYCDAHYDILYDVSMMIYIDIMLNMML